MSMRGCDLTLIVPVWNRRDLLERLLCGLRAQTEAPAEVLVVDDGSTDTSAELASRMGARVIRMEAHAGFAKAINRGIRESRTPLVAIVNNDVALAPDWLARLTAAIGPDVWFAAGRILQASAPDLIDGTYDLLCRGGASWRAGHGCPDGPAFRQPRRISSAPMTAAVFRVDLFDKVGLLDERFDSYLEDVDFGVRCALAACPGVYVPDAVAWHQGSSTLGRWHPETVRLMARNQVFLVARYYSGRMLARFLWPVVVAQGLWGLLALRHGRGWAWLRGKTAGLRRWSEFRSGSQRPPADVLGAMLARNEREMPRGNDWYWRLYFLLTRVGQSDT